jgi:hypothetical protein
MPDQLLRDALRVLNRHAVILPAAPISLRAMRDALEPLLDDGEQHRDDVSEICQKIDDELSDPATRAE